MGWKSSTIIINAASKVDHKGLLIDLGFQDLKDIGSEPFEVVIHPPEGKVYIGEYSGNIIICEFSLPHSFLEESMHWHEQILNSRFPDSEICALVLHSTVNLWGYSISKNGKKLRVRGGSAEDGTMVDYGTPLDQEKEILAKSTFDDRGNRIYYFDEFPNEPIEEDQVGENFVFEVASRYLGKPLDHADDLLFNTQLKGFTFSFPEETNKGGNKWMKYGVIVLIILVWQILKRTVFAD